MKKYIAKEDGPCCAQCANYTPVTRSKDELHEYGFCKTHNTNKEIVIENTSSNFICRSNFRDINQ